MDDNPQTRMDKLKELIRLKRYALAAHALKRWRKDILSTGNYAHAGSSLLFWSISATLAECLLFQGDYLSALDTAKDTLNIGSVDSKLLETKSWSQRDALKTIVRAVEALSSLIMHLDIDRAYGVAEEILKPLLSSRSYAYNPEQVKITSICQKIIVCASQCGICIAKTAENNARENLQPLLWHLLQEQRFDEAVTIANDIASSIDSISKMALWTYILRRLYAVEGEYICKARVHRSLALILRNENDLNKCRKHLQMALVFQAIVGDEMSQLECRVMQAAMDIHGTSVPMMSAKALMHTLLRFESLEDWSSCLSTLLELQNAGMLSFNDELYFSAGNDLNEVVGRTGSKFLLFVVQLGQTAYLLSRTANTAKALETLSSLLETARKLNIPFITGSMANSLSHACVAMKRVNLALAAARRMYDAWSLLEHQKTSEAAYTLFHVLSSFGLITMDDVGCSQIAPGLSLPVGFAASSLEEWIELDIAASAWKEAIQKLWILYEVQYGQHRSMTNPYRLKDKCQETVQRIRDLSKYLEGNEILLEVANCNLRQSLLCYLPPQSPVTNDVLSHLKAALDIYVKLGRLTDAATVRMQFGLGCFARFESNKSRDFRSLGDALEHFYQVYEASEYFGYCDLAATSSFWVAKCSIEMLSIFRHLELNQRADIIQQAHDAILGAAKWIDTKREELSLLPGIDAILSKQALAGDPQVRRVYNLAQSLCSAAGDLDSLWDWVQKGKARSVSDLLGLGWVLPKNLKKTLEGNTEAMKLLHDQEALASKISQTPPERRAILRAQHERICKLMLETDELKDLLLPRIGRSVTLQRLQSTISEAEKTVSGKIIMIDWVQSSDDRLYLLVVESTGMPRQFSLSITPAEVRMWIQSNFEEEDDREFVLNEHDDDPDARLRELDSLLAPITEFSKPGDILILSPTDPLHQLPLHALHIHEDTQDMPLLQRNPILYSASLTILEQSVFRLMHAGSRYSTSTNTPNILEEVSVIGVYGIDEMNMHLLPEQQEIHKHCQGLSARLNGVMLWDSEASKSAVQQQLRQARLVHFHGHCEFSAKNILQHHLVLGDSESTTRPSDVFQQSVSEHRRHHEAILSPIKSFLGGDSLNTEAAEVFDAPDTGSNLDPTSSSHLTVREIFESRIHSSHITLIACNSASANVRPGDEPLGLVTALLCAGAASVLGTIWPTESRAGRRFSEIFYDSCRAQSTGSGWINLALSLQEAAMMVRKDLGEIGTWAPFVLHGAWFQKDLS